MSCTARYGDGRHIALHAATFHLSFWDTPLEDALVNPTARYASLNRYIELSQSLGIDPVRLMRANGLDPSLLAFQDTRIPAAAVIQLLEDSAAESGRDDFGVRLAELRQFSNLGPLSLVLRAEPDVRSAPELMIRHEHTYKQA